MTTPNKCPACNANLQGEPIPEKSREHFGNATHFSRVIGIYDTRRDRTTDWQCPDCGHRWARLNALERNGDD